MGQLLTNLFENEKDATEKLNSDIFGGNIVISEDGEYAIINFEGKKREYKIDRKNIRNSSDFSDKIRSSKDLSDIVKTLEDLRVFNEKRNMINTDNFIENALDQKKNDPDFCKNNSDVGISINKSIPKNLYNQIGFQNQHGLQNTKPLSIKDDPNNNLISENKEENFDDKSLAATKLLYDKLLSEFLHKNGKKPKTNQMKYNKTTCNSDIKNLENELNDINDINEIKQERAKLLEILNNNQSSSENTFFSTETFNLVENSNKLLESELNLKQADFNVIDKNKERLCSSSQCFRNKTGSKYHEHYRRNISDELVKCECAEKEMFIQNHTTTIDTVFNFEKKVDSHLALDIEKEHNLFEENYNGETFTNNLYALEKESLSPDGCQNLRKRFFYPRETVNIVNKHRTLQFDPKYVSNQSDRSLFKLNRSASDGLIYFLKASELRKKINKRKKSEIKKTIKKLNSQKKKNVYEVKKICRSYSDGSFNFTRSGFQDIYIDNNLQKKQKAFQENELDYFVKSKDIDNKIKYINGENNDVDSKTNYCNAETFDENIQGCASSLINLVLSPSEICSFKAPLTYNALINSKSSCENLIQINNFNLVHGLLPTENDLTEEKPMITHETLSDPLIVLDQSSESEIKFAEIKKDSSSHDTNEKDSKDTSYIILQKDSATKSNNEVVEPRKEISTFVSFPDKPFVSSSISILEHVEPIIIIPEDFSTKAESIITDRFSLLPVLDIVSLEVETNRENEIPNEENSSNEINEKLQLGISKRSESFKFKGDYNLSRNSVNIIESIENDIETEQEKYEEPLVQPPTDSRPISGIKCNNVELFTNENQKMIAENLIAENKLLLRAHRSVVDSKIAPRSVNVNKKNLGSEKNNELHEGMNKFLVEARKKLQPIAKNMTSMKPERKFDSLKNHNELDSLKNHHEFQTNIKEPQNQFSTLIIDKSHDLETDIDEIDDEELLIALHSYRSAKSTSITVTDIDTLIETLTDIENFIETVSNIDTTIKTVSNIVTNTNTAIETVSETDNVIENMADSVNFTNTTIKTVSDIDTFIETVSDIDGASDKLSNEVTDTVIQINNVYNKKKEIDEETEEIDYDVKNNVDIKVKDIDKNKKLLNGALEITSLANCKKFVIVSKSPKKSSLRRSVSSVEKKQDQKTDRKKSRMSYSHSFKEPENFSVNVSAPCRTAKIVGPLNNPLVNSLNYKLNIVNSEIADQLLVTKCSISKNNLHNKDNLKYSEKYANATLTKLDDIPCIPLIENDLKSINNKISDRNNKVSPTNEFSKNNCTDLSEQGSSVSSNKIIDDISIRYSWDILDQKLQTDSKGKSIRNYKRDSFDIGRLFEIYQKEKEALMKESDSISDFSEISSISDGSFVSLNSLEDTILDDFFRPANQFSKIQPLQVKAIEEIKTTGEELTGQAQTCTSNSKYISKTEYFCDSNLSSFLQEQAASAVQSRRKTKTRSIPLEKIPDSKTSGTLEDINKSEPIINLQQYRDDFPFTSLAVSEMKINSIKDPINSPTFSAKVTSENNINHKQSNSFTNNFIKRRHFSDTLKRQQVLPEANDQVKPKNVNRLSFYGSLEDINCEIKNSSAKLDKKIMSQKSKENLQKIFTDDPDSSGAESFITDDVIIKSFVDSERTVVCGNPPCSKFQILRGQQKSKFKTCQSCFTCYCSNRCKKTHWEVHKRVCLYGRICKYIKSFLKQCEKGKKINRYFSKFSGENFKIYGKGCVSIKFSSLNEVKFTSKKNILPTQYCYVRLKEVDSDKQNRQNCLLQQTLRDYNPEEEFIVKISVQNQIKKNQGKYNPPSVLRCGRIPFLLTDKPSSSSLRIFSIPFINLIHMNTMETRRYFCREISMSLKRNGFVLKDNRVVYKGLCQFVESNIPFQPFVLSKLINGKKIEFYISISNFSC